ncbi:MAG: exo-alpha-sialidase [Thermoplasmatales archaeon]|nr:exo-alpha-sialidase [Thermoplasmatales archaeon]
MIKNVFRKSLVIGIIILFVGASVIPNISGDPSDPGSEIAPGDLEGWSGQMKLARTSDGVLHCVYQRSDGSYLQVYRSYSNDNGETWNEEALTSEDYDQISPSITVDSNDNLHVVWQGGHDDSPICSQIRYRKFDINWGEIDNITSDFDWDHRGPAISVDGNDHLHVVYQKINYYGEPWCTVGCGPLWYTNNIQGSWSPPEMISEGVEYRAICPCISIGPNNNVHVVWDADGYHATDCWHSAYRRNNTNFWEPLEFFPCYDSHPSIAVDSLGNVHHVVKYSYPLSGIKYRMRDDVAWVIEEIIQGTVPTYVTKRPSIALDSYEHLHVVWNDNGNIYYSKKTTDWSAIDPIISDTDSVYPSLIWSYHPEVNGARTNIPKNGYAFVWNDGSIIKFYKSADLEWDDGDSCKIEIIQPNDGDIFWIEAEPEPTMPTIDCRARVVGITPDPTATTEFSWIATIMYEYKETVFWPKPTHVEDRVFEQSFQEKNVIGGQWEPEFQNVIAGGKLRIEVKAIVNGEEYRDEVTVSIKARNPSDISVKNRLGKLIYQVICYKESRPKWHQFYPDDNPKAGLPVCAFDYGYGLMQITASPSISDIWSWSHNIKTGRQRWDNEYDRSKENEDKEINEKIKVGKPPYAKVKHLSKEQHEEAACYHYRAGYKYRYWVLEQVDDEWLWVVNPNANTDGVSYAEDAMEIKAQLEDYKKALEEGQPLPPLPYGWGTFVDD